MRFRTATLSVVAVLVLAACGAGETADTVPADSQSASQTEVADDGMSDETPEAMSEDGAEAMSEGADVGASEGADAGGSEDADGDTTGDVPESLDFSARRVGGGTVDGPDYAGQPVVLWMWAPWCPTCNREAPHVAEALAALGEGINLIGVAGLDEDDEHEGFVAEHGLEGIPHAIDDDGSLWAKYGVSYQPAWVFISPDGSTRLNAGPLYDDIEDELRAFFDA